MHIENFEAEMQLALSDPTPDFGFGYALCIIYAPFIHSWFDTHHCTIMGNRMAAQRWANVWNLMGTNWGQLVYPNTSEAFELAVSVDKRFRGLGLL